MDFFPQSLRCTFQATSFKIQLALNVVELGHELFKMIKIDCTVRILLFLEMTLKRLKVFPKVFKNLIFYI